MSKQRFHTQTSAKTFVFKHVVDAEFHLTPDEFYHQFRQSAPDEMFDLMCVCDDESNALELCRAANRADVLDSVNWQLVGGDDKPARKCSICDLAPCVCGKLVAMGIGSRDQRDADIIDELLMLGKPPMPMIQVPSFGSGNTIVIERKISYAETPFSPYHCSVCSMGVCVCLPFADLEPEKCKGCDIPFCECWDGRQDPNAEQLLARPHDPVASLKMPPIPSDALPSLLDPPSASSEPVTLCCDDFPFCGHDVKTAPLTYTYEPVEPGSCAFCSTSLVCTCHEAFNKAAKEVQANGIELPCTGLANGCVCDNCVPF